MDDRDNLPMSAWKKHQYLLTTSISGSLLACGLIMHYAGIGGAISKTVLIGSIVSGGWKVAPKAFRALKQKVSDMNVLMTSAVLGAIAIDRFEEGAAVMFLFAVSNLIERYSIDTSRRRIHALMNLSPPTATRVRDNVETEVAVKEIGVGDRLLIRPGERIPLDGTVVSGASGVNEAPVTGESQVSVRSVGDDVFAGSLNERGRLVVQVTRPYNDTTLARIVRKVEEAQADRAHIQTLGETFARYYTPVVLGGALAITVIPPLLLNQPFIDWFYRALVLLVISCPCALVISTPVTFVSALANAARHGVLIKGGRHLETIGSVQAIAFDKTGTLTAGIPQVTDVVPLNSLSEEEILHLAAEVEKHSEHPLAAGIIKRAGQHHTNRAAAAYGHFEVITGRGVHATINGKNYFIGNHALVEEKKLCSPQIEQTLSRLEREGKTTIVLAGDDAPLGIIALKDTPKEASKELVGKLHERGVKNIIMLTGDNEEIARAIANRTGIDEVYAGLLPEEKMECVRKLRMRWGTAAMVGDGINDAPALAASSVGIAMGASGTDVAMETSDIVLMSDDLSKLPFLIDLSRKTLSIIRQNMTIALLTKLVFIILGIFGSASLWMAILADDGATLVVILNGLRALRLRSSA